MKKYILILLTTLVCFFSNSTASAANWEWVDSNDEVGLFFDTETLSYTPYNDTAYVWAKFVFPLKNEEDLNYYYINFSNRTIALKSYVIYKQGAVTESQTRSSSLDYHPIIPGSLGEALYNVIKPRCK